MAATLPQHHIPHGQDGLPSFKADLPNPQSSPPNFDSSMVSNGTSPKIVPRPMADPLDALRALPEIRPIPWHPRQEVGLEKSYNSPRSQTRGAFLLVTRGEVNDPPCTRCATGVGRFAKCVTLGSFFKGACATCQMASRGNCCSLRQQKEGGVGGNVPASHPPPKQQRTTTSQILSSTEADQPNFSLKRKRHSAESSPVPVARLSYSPARAVSSPKENAQTPYDPPAPSYYTPQDLGRSDKTALLDYVYQKQHPANGKKRHQLQHKAQMVSQGAMIQGAIPVLGSYNGMENYNSAGGSIQLERNWDSTKSPSVQEVQASKTNIWNHPPSEELLEHKSTLAKNGSEAPFFDSLPRKKQKQIFTIIGGLQSSIRSARQQADSMQTQLDLLQEILGIGVDDRDESI